MFSWVNKTQLSHNSNCKKIQVLTLSLLILGVILCIFITFYILYTKLDTWLNDIEYQMIEREKEHLLLVSEARAQKIASLLTNNKYGLIFLEKAYDSVKNGTLKAAVTVPFPTIINVYDYLEGSEVYQENTTTVWLSPYTRKIEEVPEYKYLSIFIKFLQAVAICYKCQAGITFDSGTDFRFPMRNMSYVLTSPLLQTCSVYDSRCYKAYNDDKTLISDKLSLYYQDNFTYFLHSEGKTCTYYFPDNYFNIHDLSYEDYEYLITTKTGSFMIGHDNKPIVEIISNDLLTEIYKNDFMINESIKSILDHGFDKNLTSYSLSGYNSMYFIAFAPIEIYSKENDKQRLMVVTIVSRNSVLKPLSELLDGIFSLVMFQVIVFMVYFFLVFLMCWKLANFIYSKIVVPLLLIEEYIKVKKKNLNEKDFNSDISSLIRYLKKLDIIEQYVDPNFILHPNLDNRLKNLKEIKLLFIAIGNYRGVSIIKNLIGNIYIEKKNYKKAFENYKKSLLLIEDLRNYVIIQEKTEVNLTQDQKNIMKKKLGKTLFSWISEKSLIDENRIDKINQVCYGLRLYLEGKNDNGKDRDKQRQEWKKLQDLQIIVLNYYISKSKHLIRLLKLLIDIAYVRHKLQSYHTSMELLEIVSDELGKLVTENSELEKSQACGYEIDIDITRLMRANIVIKENKERRQPFHVPAVTFEKDILKQEILYMRGMIFKDNNKLQEAGLFFTMAIEQGIWFNPTIRKECINELYKIFDVYESIPQVPLLEELYKKYNSKKASTVLCLDYDINKECDINNLIVAMVSEEIQSQYENFGAVTSYAKFHLKMEVVERDYPGFDMENFLGSTVKCIKRNHVYDVLLEGLKMLPKDSTKNTLILIVKDIHNDLGAVRIGNLKEFILDTTIYIVVCSCEVPIPIRKLEKNYLCNVIYGDDIADNFEELKEYIFGFD
ncbi:hypothetical protein SteCoe_14509 [Stentor coeruleus]|uniref:Uncharacterized protein n=1 Tax=Stentor coeruleus TaxID=5963 RepID=A0A1R2C5V1_9CILI|nr:hypothetical protein SteCoe_14509 [Stentor coeruleus]